MEHQPSVASAEFRAKKKVTRREKFLAEMERVVPWARLAVLIAPHYELNLSMQGMDFRLCNRNALTNSTQNGEPTVGKIAKNYQENGGTASTLYSAFP